MCSSDLVAVAAVVLVVRGCHVLFRFFVHAGHGLHRFQRVAACGIFLDSCQADRLSGALAAGASVTFLAGMITAETGAGPAVAGAIAGVLGFYGGLTQICNSWDTGIAIVYIPYPSVLTCVPQQ